MGKLRFLENGYDWHRTPLSSAQLKPLNDGLAHHPLKAQLSGLRQVERQIPAVADFIHGEVIDELVSSYLGEKGCFLRALLFDKRPERNWPVGWHQDLALVTEHPERFPAITPWRKRGHSYHHQGHLSALENMLTVRLHIDDADRQNGCLKLIPKTHRLGILNAETIQDFCNSHPEQHCEARAGELLVMSPLILHASSRSQLPTHRRVLHIEFIRRRFIEQQQGHSTNT